MACSWAVSWIGGRAYVGLALHRVNGVHGNLTASIAIDATLMPPM